MGRGGAGRAGGGDGPLPACGCAGEVLDFMSHLQVQVHVPKYL